VVVARRVLEHWQDMIDEVRMGIIGTQISNV